MCQTREARRGWREPGQLRLPSALCSGQPGWGNPSLRASVRWLCQSLSSCCCRKLPSVQRSVKRLRLNKPTVNLSNQTLFRFASSFTSSSLNDAFCCVSLCSTCATQSSFDTKSQFSSVGLCVRLHNASSIVLFDPRASQSSHEVPYPPPSLLSH